MSNFIYLLVFIADNIVSRGIYEK